MPETQHTYHGSIAWTDGKHGTARTSGRPDIAVGAPPEFGGDDRRWSPEHLCIASVNACLMLAFIAVAEHSKMPFHSYSAEASGELAKVEGRGMAITRIVVRPQIAVPAGVTREKVEQVLRIAKRNCFISNSLSSEVVLEPEIVTG